MCWISCSFMTSPTFLLFIINIKKKHLCKINTRKILNARGNKSQTATPQKLVRPYRWESSHTLGLFQQLVFKNIPQHTAVTVYIPARPEGLWASSRSNRCGWWILGLQELGDEEGPGESCWFPLNANTSNGLFVFAHWFFSFRREVAKKGD